MTFLRHAATLLLLAAINVSAQSIDPYSPPTGQERWQVYVHETFGFGALFRAVITGAADQAKPAVPEWRGGVEGYAKRFGNRAAQFTISDTVKHGLSAALQQDIRFVPCSCTAVMPRLGHALLEGVTARNQQGHRILSIPKLVGPYAGTFATTAAWYPHRYGVQDAARLSNISLGVQIGAGIFKEFIPALR